MGRSQEKGVGHSENFSVLFPGKIGQFPEHFFITLLSAHIRLYYTNFFLNRKEKSILLSYELHCNRVELSWNYSFFKHKGTKYLWYKELVKIFVLYGAKAFIYGKGPQKPLGFYTPAKTLVSPHVHLDPAGSWADKFYESE